VTKDWARRKLELHAFLDPPQAQRLRRLLLRSGMSFRAWVEEQIRADEVRQLSRATKRLRLEVSEQAVRLAEETLTVHGQGLLAASERVRDPGEKLSLRQKARPYLDAAS